MRLAVWFKRLYIVFDGINLSYQSETMHEIERLRVCVPCAAWQVTLTNFEGAPSFSCMRVPHFQSMSAGQLCLLFVVEDDSVPSLKAHRLFANVCDMDWALQIRRIFSPQHRHYFKNCQHQKNCSSCNNNNNNNKNKNKNKFNNNNNNNGDISQSTSSFPLLWVHFRFWVYIIHQNVGANSQAMTLLENLFNFLRSLVWLAIQLTPFIAIGLFYTAGVPTGEGGRRNIEAPFLENCSAIKRPRNWPCLSLHHFNNWQF